MLRNVVVTKKCRFHENHPSFCELIWNDHRKKDTIEIGIAEFIWIIIMRKFTFPELHIRHPWLHHLHVSSHLRDQPSFSVPALWRSTHKFRVDRVTSHTAKYGKMTILQVYFLVIFDAHFWAQTIYFYLFFCRLFRIFFKFKLTLGTRTYKYIRY